MFLEPNRIIGAATEELNAIRCRGDDHVFFLIIKLFLIIIIKLMIKLSFFGDRLFVAAP